MAAPKTDTETPIVDIQLSVAGDQLGHESQQTIDIHQAIKNAGIKYPGAFTCDPAVKEDVMVLWVGVKSPDSVKPSYYLSPTSPALKTLTNF